MKSSRTAAEEPGESRNTFSNLISPVEPTLPPLEQVAAGDLDRSAVSELEKILMENVMAYEQASSNIYTLTGKINERMNATIAQMDAKAKTTHQSPSLSASMLQSPIQFPGAGYRPQAPSAIDRAGPALKEVERSIAQQQADFDEQAALGAGTSFDAQLPPVRGAHFDETGRRSLVFERSAAQQRQAAEQGRAQRFAAMTFGEAAAWIAAQSQPWHAETALRLFARVEGLVFPEPGPGAPAGKIPDLCEELARDEVAATLSTKTLVEH